METQTMSLLIMFTVAILLAPTTNAIETRKVLAIPEKIIGGVIDIVQSHKNKPSQQSSFQQSVQTQQTFMQQGYPQQNPQYQPWSTGFSGQAQIQAAGQIDANHGNFQNTNYQQQSFPVNGQYQPSFGQSQLQGPYQNYPQNQSGGQFQNQNQQTGFNQNQNGYQQGQGSFQTGQYGSGNYVGSGQYGGQTGNYQGQNGQTGSFGQGTAQNGGHFSQQSTQFGSSGQPGQTGNYQTSQTSHNQGTSGQSGSFTTSQGSYQGSNGQFTGTSGQQTGTNVPSCVCQAWTKPPEIQHDSTGKSDTNVTEQNASAKVKYYY